MQPMSGGGGDRSPEWVGEGSQTLGTLQSMCQEAAGSGHTWWSLRFMAWALAQQQGPGRTSLSASGCRAQSRVPHASRGFPDLDAGCGAQSRVPTPPEVSLGWALDAGLRAEYPTPPEGSLGSEQGPPHCQRVLWAGYWALSEHPIVLAQEDVPWDSSSGGSQLSPHCARF